MTALRGIWSAVPTPSDAQFEPDAARAVAFCADLLAGGCDGINLLGTTGQAMSFPLASRLALMDAVAASGLPMERAMCGVGAASLRDAMELTRAAAAARFAAALVMPPFFYRDASDDGFLRFFDAVVDAAPVALMLYHFPAMSGRPYHPDLVTDLVGRYPGRIVGIKDSSNDRVYRAEILERHPELAFFPGSEAGLLASLDDGAAGCISGSVCLWPGLARRVYRDRDVRAGAELDDLRAGLAGAPLIPQVHERLARVRNDDAWRRVVPPLGGA